MMWPFKDFAKSSFRKKFVYITWLGHINLIDAKQSLTGSAAIVK